MGALTGMYCSWCRVGKMLKTVDVKYLLEVCQQMWPRTNWKSILLDTDKYVRDYVCCRYVLTFFL